MPHRLLIPSAALAGALSVVPAHAGTPEDPEIQGNCSRSSQAAVAVGDEHIICAAWFSAGGQQQPRLTATVQTQEDLAQRTEPLRIALTWQREDDCREGWVFSDQLDAPDTLELERSCPGQTLVRVPLDASRARFSGRDLAVELTGADLAQVSSGLALGDVLTRPVAYSMVLVRSSTTSVEVATGIDATDPGRDYVVAS